MFPVREHPDGLNHRPDTKQPRVACLQQEFVQTLRISVPGGNWLQTPFLPLMQAISQHFSWASSVALPWLFIGLSRGPVAGERSTVNT